MHYLFPDMCIYIFREHFQKETQENVKSGWHKLFKNVKI